MPATPTPPLQPEGNRGDTFWSLQFVKTVKLTRGVEAIGRAGKDQ